ncbi:uncharacterized protein LOC143028644 [Oratosquilla oratoria]|uniref:uncharacterized protein LOC143028644 n=1 Tax=Oratosquilla oratoria TaxID=337810 RepID=UPI003F774593
MGPKAVSHVDAKRVAQFFWSDGVWCKKCTTKLKDHSVSQTQRLLSLQGMSLEEVMEWKRIFSPSACPLLGLLLEYRNVYRQDQGNDAADMLKISEELLTYSFKKLMLDWPRQLGPVQGALIQSGSLVEVQSEGKKGHQGAASKEYAKQKRKPKCEGVISIPQPWQRYWICPPLEKIEKSKSWDTLPKSFRWLLSIGSHITQTTDEDLLSLICSIEQMLKDCQK